MKFPDPIVLEIDDSSNQITNSEKLEELNIPKELLTKSMSIIENHNLKVQITKTYRLMVVSMFIGGLILLLGIFCVVFFTSISHYFLLLGGILIIFCMCYFYFQSIKHRDLLDHTLVKLVEGTFHVLIIKKRLKLITKFKEGQNLEDDLEEMEKVAGLEVSINVRRLEKYIKDKYRLEDATNDSQRRESEEEEEARPEPELRF